ncbi:MAG: hypothetical protein LBE10_05270 [Treponema sp.]|jgi:hypothetical protein|nr:hypothetical protein [Treponema sp.]
MWKSELFWVLAVFVVLFVSSCSTLTVRDIGDLARDMGRHNSFKYINSKTLSESWFGAAAETMDEPAVYIVLSDTGSPASKLISMFTKKRYNHVSLALDAGLETLVSYNNGRGRGKPGLNPERIEDLNLKPDASIAVYQLAARPEQKQAIIGRIERINREGNAYNLLGLVTKQSFQPNIMFCSQFVYTMLDEAGLDYFEMQNSRVQPEDFVDRNSAGYLAFMYEEQLNVPTLTPANMPPKNFLP